MVYSIVKYKLYDGKPVIIALFANYEICRTALHAIAVEHPINDKGYGYELRGLKGDSHKIGDALER